MKGFRMLGVVLKRLVKGELAVDKEDWRPWDGRFREKGRHIEILEERIFVL